MSNQYKQELPAWLQIELEKEEILMKNKKEKTQECKFNCPCDQYCLNPSNCPNKK